MSENAAPASTGWMRKKVLGIPAIYLAGGFVVILAALAWKMKPAASAADTTAADAASTQPENASDTILQDSGTLPALPLGTVVAPPSEQTDTSGNTAITDNDEWLKRGVSFLISKGENPGDAQAALQAYLDGVELSYTQGGMRDDVIREYGLPPTPPAIGGTRPDIARVQGPLPRGHVVKGPADNTATELASLYYGRNDTFAVGTITTANGGRATFNVGETVQIPVLPKPTTPASPAPKPVTPAPKPAPKPTRYYTVKAGDSLSKIAVKYYRNGNLWTKIWNANRAQIKNPNLIHPGQRLVIPY